MSSLCAQGLAGLDFGGAAGGEDESRRQILSSGSTSQINDILVAEMAVKP
jgi:hypothetical protein